jgi:hypothetical protein
MSGFEIFKFDNYLRTLYSSDLISGASAEQYGLLLEAGYSGVSTKNFSPDMPAFYTDISQFPYVVSGIFCNYRGAFHEKRV